MKWLFSSSLFTTYCVLAEGCSNVRIDANLEVLDLSNDESRCDNCAQDVSITSFQSRTFELDRQLFHHHESEGSYTTNQTGIGGITLLPSYVQTFPTTNGQEIIEECSPYIEWKWEQTIPAVGITYGGSLYDKRLRALTEGMNVNGLTVSVQLFRGNQFHHLTKEEVVEKKAIPDICYGMALLTSYSTVGEIIDDSNEGGPLHYVFDWTFGKSKGIGFHWVVDDAQGNHVVIEFVNGQPKFWNATSVRVVTNDPCYDWHIQNVNNYAITSSVSQVDPLLVVEDETFGKVPQLVGTGMNTRALPGDFTSASRFIKLFYLNRLQQMASKTSFAENFAAANALISSVFIPWGVDPGVAKQHGIESDDYEWTEWTVIKVYGGGQRKFYFKSYFDNTYKLIDLTKIVNFATNERIEINPVDRRPGINDLGIVESQLGMKRKSLRYGNGSVIY